MFRYSKVGIAMQASSQNQLAAYYMGIPVKRLNGLVWGLAAAVAAIAGLLLAPITFVHANMGFIGLKAIPGRGGRRLRQPAGRHRRRARSSASSNRSRASTCPRASRTSPPTSWCWSCWWCKPNGLFGEKLRKKV